MGARLAGVGVLPHVTVWPGGTVGRVPYIGAGKVIADDAGLTYDPVGDTLTALTQIRSDGAGSAFIATNGSYNSSKSGGNAYQAASSDLGDIAGGHRQNIGGWVRDNIAASLTNSQLGRFVTANPQLQWRAPRAGSVMSVGSVFTVATAGASITISVFKNGSLLASHAIGTGVTSNMQAYAKDAQVFAAGDLIDIRITTPAGWTAVTSDLVVDVEVEY